MDQNRLAAGAYNIAGDGVVSVSDMVSERIPRKIGPVKAGWFAGLRVDELRCAYGDRAGSVGRSDTDFSAAGPAGESCGGRGMKF